MKAEATIEVAVGAQEKDEEVATTVTVNGTTQPTDSKGFLITVCQGTCTVRYSLCFTTQQRSMYNLACSCY